jgi:hypothetical protein
VTKEQAKEARRAERAKQLKEKRLLEVAINKQGVARRPIRNEGAIVERKPLAVWERYAQALLFTNEVTYVN